KVGRMGIAGDVGIARGVHCDAEPEVITAAAEVRGENQPIAERIKLGDKGIHAATIGGLEGVAGNGKVGGIGRPGDVGAARSVYGDALAFVTGAAAQVGGVQQHGVNDQRLAVVVARHFKGHAVVGGKDVTAI